jgi:coatomer subunit beta
VLDVLVINQVTPPTLCRGDGPHPRCSHAHQTHNVVQTPDTLQNLCLELATLGDLKLCERPRNYNLGPFESKRIRANIKVSSTETGIIFGNIVYDVAGQATTLNADKNCVILNDIHIDIMDYISPAQCTHAEFRNMWSEFEWENKVVVNTEIRYRQCRRP